MDVIGNGAEDRSREDTSVCVLTCHLKKDSSKRLLYLRLPSKDRGTYTAVMVVRPMVVKHSASWAWSASGDQAGG